MLFCIHRKNRLCYVESTYSHLFWEAVCIKSRGYAYMVMLTAGVFCKRLGPGCMEGWSQRHKPASEELFPYNDY